MLAWKVQPITVMRNGCTDAQATKFIIGDANGDGVVDDEDKAFLMDDVIGGSVPKEGRHDVDGDGRVSIGDWSTLSKIIAGTLTPADGLFYISFDLTADDGRYMVLFHNTGSEALTVAALPGTRGALEKEIELREGAVSAFTFDSGYFKHTQGEHKGKILFSASSHSVEMWVFEIK